MGEVYDIRLRSDLAVCLIHAELAGDPDVADEVVAVELQGRQVDDVARLDLVGFLPFVHAALGNNALQ